MSARFRSVSYLHTRGPGLAGHLSALQHATMTDLDTVRHLLEHCVPPHYRLTGAYLRASHQCLHAHLAQVSGVNIKVCVKKRKNKKTKPQVSPISVIYTHVSDVCGLGQQLGPGEWRNLCRAQLGAAHLQQVRSRSTSEVEVNR